ncbi:MAG: ABC transporter ATP-binding protein [Myxococcaceae bacterium]
MADAIVLKQVTKHFKKRAVRSEYTTIKSELVRMITRKRKVLEPSMLIQALKGVDLNIPKGSTVGIVGRNGSGKSTLLKLITGIYAPSSGTIDVHGRISALLDLGAGFHPDFTGRENILINGIILGMSRAEVKARTPEIIEFAELGDFIDEPVRTYSSGMFMRLAFAVATHVDPEILIIDELLAVGDEHFQRKSMGKMTEFKASGKTIILVTHDLGTVQRWCDLAAWIDGGVTRMVGPPGQVIDAYRRAVNLAESSQSDALTAPGIALPALPPPPPPSTTPKLKAVRLLDVSGRQVERLHLDARLDVCLDFETPPNEALAFTVELVQADGQVMFTTTMDAGSSPGKGTAKLTFSRLGVGEGMWTVRCSAHGPGEKAPHLDAVLQVDNHGAGAGTLRPPHVWSLDSSASRGEVEQHAPHGAQR